MRVLIPVDFSPKEKIALKVGFHLADRLKLKVTLIHASVVASPTIFPQFPDDFNGMDNEASEIEEMELDEEVLTISEHSMGVLKKSITISQNRGELPNVDFDTLIAPGMPEEVIAEYCALTPPAVIVMATRGEQKRSEELIGSVTAEVIDHCISPVFTVPEDYNFEGFNEIKRICAFCFFDDSAIKSISFLFETLENSVERIFLFPATDKFKGEDLKSQLQKVADRLKDQYQDCQFIISDLTQGKNFRLELEQIFEKNKIQLILAPNRKRNALARFFNPGLAHKILYEIDYPLMVVPVNQ